jgi:hypothetical protein
MEYQAMVSQVGAALAAPFPAGELQHKPARVTGNRCFVVPYIDARQVMVRLDAVCGVEGWQDNYEMLPGGAVMCSLSLRLGDQWVTKCDAGNAPTGGQGDPI